MDLIRKIEANRQAKGLLPDMMTKQSGKKPSKAERAKQYESGSRGMRSFIINDKPNKKIVVKHFEALIAQECQSSSDEE
jgi:hypothetical protein